MSNTLRYGQDRSSAPNSTAPSQPWPRSSSHRQGLGRVPARAAIVADLVAAGYVVKDKDGPRQRTIGEMLDLLIGAKPTAALTGHARPMMWLTVDNDESPHVQPIRPAVDEAWTAAHRDGS